MPWIIELLPLAERFRRVKPVEVSSGPEIDWLLVLLYAAAAGACFWAMRKQQQAQRRAYEARVPRFWMMMGALLAAMAAARMLNVQETVGNAARRELRQEGEYQERRPAQKILVLEAIAFGGLAAAGLAVWFARKVWRQYLAPTIGAAVLITVVAVRAVSLHSVDHFMSDNTCMGIRFGGLFEGIPLLVIAAAAGVAIYRDYRPKMRAFETRVRIR